MKITGGIDRGLAYIASQQLASGGFTSLSSPRPTEFIRARTYQTTFFPSLVLSALHALPHPQALEIRWMISDFLLNQKSKEWTFNYWDRYSPHAQAKPYPDDLDDTFCALSALYQQEPALMTGNVMAAIAQTLIAAEVRPGGPYRTWLVNKTSDPTWRDIDVGVNANIGQFLSLHDVRLLGIVSYVEEALQGSLQSPYYPDEYPLLYFIGRWYRESKSHLVVEQLLSTQKHGHWSTPLHTALAMTTLLHYMVPPQQLAMAYQYLEKQQAADGSWPAQAFCIDPAVGGKTYYAGASALTTAFCLEALWLYEHCERQVIRTIPSSKPKTVQYRRVLRVVKQTIDNLPSLDIQHCTNEVLQQIIGQDTDGQIVLLPWFVMKAASTEVSQDILQQLAVASLWGWMAYTTYDDFLDNEGDPRLLSSANVSLRNLVKSHMQTLPDRIDFQTDAQQIMDRIDAANAWEVGHCRGHVQEGIFYIKRLPDYGDLSQLADRSLGHTIAGLGVLYAAGYEADSRAMISLRRFFNHYLIARQLNDDAHDWEEDIRNGHVNAVAVMILKRWVRVKRSLSHGINFDTDAEILRQIMWERVIVEVCDLIRYHITAARESIQAKGVDLKSEPFEKFLKPLEASADEALRQRDEALSFIKAL